MSACGVVQRLQAHSNDLPELLFGYFGANRPGTCQVGTIQLQDDAGLVYRVVLQLHGVRHREQVLLRGREVTIGHVHLDTTRALVPSGSPHRDQILVTYRPSPVQVPHLSFGPVRQRDWLSYWPTSEQRPHRRNRCGSLTRRHEYEPPSITRPQIGADYQLTTPDARRNRETRC